MRKFMKYEIKGSYKFILGILILVLIASTVIQINVSKQVKLESLNQSVNISVFNGTMMIISILVIFGAFLTAFFHIIGSFRKELYEDRGYLTFTLPLTGNKIVGGKLIVALMWYVVLGLGILLYNALLTLILYGYGWIDTVKYIFNAFSDLNNGLISIGIISGLSVITTLILIYFSIALSRVSVKNKRIGGLWFIIFIVLSVVYNYITLKVSGLFPYYLSVNNFKILHHYDIMTIPGITEGIGQIMLFGMNYQAYINIIGNLTQILIAVLAFIATGYLIEKKIDL